MCLQLTLLLGSQDVLHPLSVIQDTVAQDAVAWDAVVWDTLFSAAAIVNFISWLPWNILNEQKSLDSLNKPKQYTVS